MVVKIVIIPTQGFCNRIRAMSSAFVLSKYLNTQFYVIWDKEIGCNCDWKTIFTNRFDSISINDIKKFKYFFNPSLHTNEVLSKYSNLNDIEYLVIQGGHEFKHPNQSLANFINEKSKFYKSLKFTSNIMDKVNFILEDKFYNEKPIGIHFRDFIETHDKADAYNFTKVSTPEAFVHYINSLIKTQPNVKLFLSTNSDRIIKIIKNSIKNYEKHIITLDDNDKSRESNEGIIDAVVDLLLLSECKYIIGTISSSFSDEACFFNKISKLCIGSENIEKYHCFGFDTILGYKMLLPNFNILCDIYKEEEQ